MRLWEDGGLKEEVNERACWPTMMQRIRDAIMVHGREGGGNREAGMVGAKGDITGKSLAKHARTHRWCKKGGTKRRKD